MTTSIFRAAVFASALSVGMVGTAATTAAEPQLVVGGGLVNLQIGSIDVETGDILSDNTVQVNLGVALNLAANVCDVAVNVLAQQIKSGDVSCRSAADGGVIDFANISR